MNNTTLYTIETLNNRQGKTDTYDEIRMIDESGELYVTYVVPGYRNRSGWSSIVNNPDTGFVLHGCEVAQTGRAPNRKPKRVLTGVMAGATIIDADSSPVLDMHMPQAELLEFVRDEIASKRLGGADPDDDLFTWSGYPT